MGVVDDVKRFKSLPVPPSELHSAMCHIAKTLIDMPLGYEGDLAYWRGDLTPVFCRAVCEHLAVGRIGIWEEVEFNKGDLQMYPCEGLAEWWAENADRELPKDINGDVGSLPIVDIKPTGTKGRDWKRQLVTKQLLKMAKTNYKFTTREKLAQRLNCSDTLVHNIVANEPKLEQWERRWKGPKKSKSPRTQKLTEVATDNIEGTVPDPTNQIVLQDELAQHDKYWQRIVEIVQKRHGPEFKEELLNLPDDKKLEAIRLYRDNPDLLSPGAEID